MLFACGFVLFAAAAMRAPSTGAPKADGIVVLTGGEHRLSEAARLLAEGRGKRLLISGANRMATREDLQRKSGLPISLFECCVDVGYDAHTTSGNALVLEQFHTLARSQTLYAEYDADYNVTSITNSSGGVVERYSYDPYGNVTVLNRDESIIPQMLAVRYVMTFDYKRAAQSMMGGGSGFNPYSLGLYRGEYEGKRLAEAGKSAKKDGNAL